MASFHIDEAGIGCDFIVTFLPFACNDTMQFC